MIFRDILDVKAICECGSLRKAAEQLGITQSTLSTRLAHLEDRLGATLFERSRGASRPTDLALFIASRAGTIAEDASVLARDAARIASGKSGTVRIGLGPFVARAIVPDLIAMISDKFPAIRLEIVSEARDNLEDLLLKRRVDIAVCQVFMVDRKQIEADVLLQTDIVFVAAPGHPVFTRAAAPSLSELFCYPLATTFLDRGYVNLTREHFGIDAESLPGRIVCSDIQLLLNAVMQSRRLVLGAPRIGLKREIEAGELRVIDVVLPFRHDVALYTNRDAYPFPAVKTVQRVIRELIA